MNMKIINYYNNPCINLNKIEIIFKKPSISKLKENQQNIILMIRSQINI